MLRVQCNQCQASAYTDNVDNPDDALACACCPQDHSHGLSANECPGAGVNHGDASCPHPDPQACTVVTPPGEDCPGGHCGLGVPDCRVCRPVTITVMALVLPAGTGVN